MNRALLKENAKKSLQGKYGDAIALLGIMFAFSFALGLVIVFFGLEEDLASTLSDLCSLLISCALGFGMTSYFLKISRNEPVTYNELFSKTNMFVSYLSISLLVALTSKVILLPVASVLLHTAVVTLFPQPVKSKTDVNVNTKANSFFMFSPHYNNHITDNIYFQWDIKSKKLIPLHKSFKY